MGRVTVVPIRPADLDRVGEFLHRHLNNRIAASGWAGALNPPWHVTSPNHGFMLLAGDEIAGAYAAIYSDRVVEGREVKFCNLAAWCVLPKYRLYGLQLLKALLNQPGYHFTDLSPSGNTVPINERQNFAHLDTATALLVNIPWLSWPGRYRLRTERADIESVLTGSELQVYRDHLGARAARQLVISDGERHCLVVFRRDRRKNLPLFASVLYLSEPSLFRSLVGVFARHLLVHYRIPLTLLESRVVGAFPAGSIRLRRVRPKMFRSDSLKPEQIDNLYSELVCVAW